MAELRCGVATAGGSAEPARGAPGAINGVPGDVVARLTRALDRAPKTSFLLLEPDMTIAWASQSSALLTGIPPHERVGANALDGVHPDDVRRLTHGFLQLLAASEEQVDIPAVSEPLRYRFRNATGEWAVYESIVHNMLTDPDVGGLLVESHIVHVGDGVGGVVDLLVDEAPLEDVLSACANLVPPYLGAAAVLARVEGRSVVGVAERGPVGDLMHDPRWWEEALDKGVTVAPEDFTGFADDMVEHARNLGFRTAWLSPVTERSSGDVVGCLLVLARIDVAFDLAADGSLRQAIRIASLAISEERRRSFLRRQAATDPLTGLANRSALRRRLDDATGDVTLVAIDLDAFKPVNDAHGHATGDAVLQVVAERLHSVVREDDLVVRFGGDEFAVVLSPDAPEAAVGSLVQRVIAALEAPIVLDGLTLTVGASVGVATASAENVVHDADTALYEAKRARRAKPSLWARRAKRVVRAVSPDPE
jgi:diguanylate cyclase (GGDEF)-like protein